MVALHVCQKQESSEGLSEQFCRLKHAIEKATGYSGNGLGPGVQTQVLLSFPLYRHLILQITLPWLNLNFLMCKIELPVCLHGNYMVQRIQWGESSMKHVKAFPNAK